MNRFFLSTSAIVFMSICFSGPVFGVMGYKGVDMRPYEEEGEKYQSVVPVFADNGLGERKWVSSGSIVELSNGLRGLLTTATACTSMTSDKTATPLNGHIVLDGVKYPYSKENVILNPSYKTTGSSFDTAFVLLSGLPSSVEALKIKPISAANVRQKNKGVVVGFGIPYFFSEEEGIVRDFKETAQSTIPKKKAAPINTTLKKNKGEKGGLMHEAVISSKNKEEFKTSMAPVFMDLGGPFLEEKKIVGVFVGGDMLPEEYAEKYFFSKVKTFLNGKTIHSKFAAVTPEFINYVQEEVKKRLITKEDLSRALEVVNKTPLPASAPVQEPDKINIPVGQAIMAQ